MTLPMVVPPWIVHCLIFRVQAFGEISAYLAIYGNLGEMLSVSFSASVNENDKNHSSNEDMGRIGGNV